MNGRISIPVTLCPCCSKYSYGFSDEVRASGTVWFIRECSSAMSDIAIFGPAMLSLDLPDNINGIAATGLRIVVAKTATAYGMQ